MFNISAFSFDETANTRYDIALQRASNLKKIGTSKVLELCVGPSLRVLESAYKLNKIEVTGNDLEIRWKQSYPNGRWIIGDCFKIDWSDNDTIVFAPPLSKSCSGKREDSLSIENVNPSYYNFLNLFLKKEKYKRGVLVLPARSLSTKNDRNEFYKLLSFLRRNNLFIKPIEMKTSGKRNIRKYIDIYIERN